MAVEKHTLFSGVEYHLEHYNGKGVGVAFDFFHDDGETEFTFPDIVSLTLEIYDERQERLLFTFTSPNLSQTGNQVDVSIPAASLTFSYTGDYYYHLCWLASGGYEQVLLYGNFKVI